MEVTSVFRDADRLVMFDALSTRDSGQHRGDFVRAIVGSEE